MSTLHPDIESVVHEQVHQNRAYHSALWRTAFPRQLLALGSLERRSQPSFDANGEVMVASVVPTHQRGKFRSVLGFSEDRAVVIGLPSDFNFDSAIATATDIRLATAFAHLKGWKLIAPAFLKSISLGFGGLLVRGGVWCNICATSPKVCFAAGSRQLRRQA